MLTSYMHLTRISVQVAPVGSTVMPLALICICIRPTPDDSVGYVVISNTQCCLRYCEYLHTDFLTQFTLMSMLSLISRG